jgi:5-methylcytosine-specific restriction endonuclease McrA
MLAKLHRDLMYERGTKPFLSSKTLNRYYYSHHFLHVNVESLDERQQKHANEVAQNHMPVSSAIKKFVASRQKWCCKECNMLLNHAYEVDHIIPRERQGGTNDIDNLQALCRNCHGEKTFRQRVLHSLH